MPVVATGASASDADSSAFGPDEARALARRAHAGQLDKGGAPYLEHVLRVAAAVAPSGPRAVMAALLHDVVEDTDVTFADLRAAGVPADVLAAVDALTKRPGEAYLDAVARAARHPLARVVKLADNADNADEARLSQLDEGTAARLREKYRQARAVLVAAAAEGSDPGR